MGVDLFLLLITYTQTIIIYFNIGPWGPWEGSTGINRRNLCNSTNVLLYKI